jgi:hypothetical protein
VDRRSCEQAEDNRRNHAEPYAPHRVHFIMRLTGFRTFSGAIRLQLCPQIHTLTDH